MSPRVAGPVKLQPLWLRVERNRLRLAAFIAGFLVAAVVAAEIALFLPLMLLLFLAMAIALRVGEMGVAEAIGRVVMSPAPVAVWVGAAAVVASAAYVAYVLTRPLRKQLAALGARPVPLGELRDTKHALKQMAIAAGIDPEPELFTVDSSGVNAFIIARGRHRPFAVVTTALAERCTRDEQAAVFANLMARLLAGDVHWATAVSALMAPLWRWRDWDLSRGQASELAEAGKGDAPSEVFMAGDRGGRALASARVPGAGGGGGEVALVMAWGMLAYFIAVIASEVVMFGHRRSHLISSEAADAEGMLLLKDSRLMLRALKRIIEADNTVRLPLPLYAGLFYIWAGDDLTDENDPEWERVRRLREVVGVDGMADADDESTAAVVAAMGDTALGAPPAPVMEDAVPSASERFAPTVRSVKPWDDRIVSPWYVAAVGFSGVAALNACVILSVFGSPKVSVRILAALPVVAAALGFTTQRAWTGIAATVAGGLMAAVAAASRPLIGVVEGRTVTVAEALIWVGVSLVTSVVGGLLGRAVWGARARSAG